MLSLLSSCCLLRIDNGTPRQVQLYCGSCNSFQRADIYRVRNNYKQSTTIVQQKPKEYLLFASSLECLGAFALVTFLGMTFCTYFKETVSRQQLLKSHCAPNSGSCIFKLLLNCCFKQLAQLVSVCSLLLLTTQNHKRQCLAKNDSLSGFLNGIFSLLLT